MRTYITDHSLNDENINIFSQKKIIKKLQKF